MKVKFCVFSCYKQTNKVCLVYLECKLQQDSIAWCIFKLEYRKTIKKKKKFMRVAINKQGTSDLFKC